MWRGGVRRDSFVYQQRALTARGFSIHPVSSTLIACKRGLEGGGGEIRSWRLREEACCAVICYQFFIKSQEGSKETIEMGNGHSLHAHKVCADSLSSAVFPEPSWDNVNSEELEMTDFSRGSNPHHSFGDGRKDPTTTCVQDLQDFEDDEEFEEELSWLMSSEDYLVACCLAPDSKEAWQDGQFQEEDMLVDEDDDEDEDFDNLSDKHRTLFQLSQKTGKYSIDDNGFPPKRRFSTTEPSSGLKQTWCSPLPSRSLVWKWMLPAGQTTTRPQKTTMIDMASQCPTGQQRVGTVQVSWTVAEGQDEMERAEVDWLCEPEWNNQEMEIFWHLLEPHFKKLLQVRDWRQLPDPCLPIVFLDPGDSHLLDRSLLHIQWHIWKGHYSQAVSDFRFVKGHFECSSRSLFLCKDRRDDIENLKLISVMDVSLPETLSEQIVTGPQPRKQMLHIRAQTVTTVRTNVLSLMKAAIPLTNSILQRTVPGLGLHPPGGVWPRDNSSDRESVGVCLIYTRHRRSSTGRKRGNVESPH
ncbi:hypothetical protein C0Q70_21337 [Pomacea canaliculata]|uniref:Uncharacterized protein n=1 Tax=Pomacea canaliculata TaxID=400727 RepID=A0A2T7NCA2_POMCA|nr:hypothetical protein C0Q70_21337 [Pomacea canaliculata]